MFVWIIFVCFFVGSTFLVLLISLFAISVFVGYFLVGLLLFVYGFFFNFSHLSVYFPPPGQSGNQFFQNVPLFLLLFFFCLLLMLRLPLFWLSDSGSGQCWEEPGWSQVLRGKYLDFQIQIIRIVISQKFK